MERLKPPNLFWRFTQVKTLGKRASHCSVSCNSLRTLPEILRKSKFKVFFFLRLGMWHVLGDEHVFTLEGHVPPVAKVIPVEPIFLHGSAGGNPVQHFMFELV